MATLKTPTLEQLRTEFRRFPAPVVEEFDKARARMPRTLDDGNILLWGNAGLKIADQTVRSWEATSQYFRVSPKVVAYMPFSYFMKWTDCGSDLCRESPTLAAAYFEASPAAMSKLRSRHIESWASLGGSLYKGTWKSSTLACKFFTFSPALMDSLTFQELERFVAFLDALSHRSYDLSAECLALGAKIFPLIGDDKTAFITLASALVDSGWREVKSFFDAGAKALPKIDPEQRFRFLKIAEDMVHRGGSNIPGVMLETSQAFAEIDPEQHETILTLAERLLAESPQAVPEFIKASAQVMDKLSMNQLERWYDEGVNLLRQNPDGGLAYFKIESAHAETMLEALSSGVEFERIKQIMEMYCRGLAGEEVSLSASADLVGRNIGWASADTPTTEGSTVYVPEVVDRYQTKDENFSWFKVVSTHQVARLEFGSFFFKFDNPSALYDDLRYEAEIKRAAASPNGAVNGAGDPVALVGDGPDDESGRAYITDMQRFFNLFEDRQLALDIFTVVEDGRLDFRVKYEYPGIKASYQRVQRDAAGDRPDITEMPAREALVEFLVRLSLQQYSEIPAPSDYADQARQIAAIAQHILDVEATVEDTAEATLRIYAIISEIANEEVEPDDWEDVDVEQEQDEEYEDPDDMQQLIQQMAMGMDMEMRPDAEQDYESSEEVDYRGDFKPELTQLLTQLRMQEGGAEGEGEPITQEQLEELLQNSAELDFEAVEGDIQETQGMFADNLLKEAGLQLPDNPDFSNGPFVHVDEDGDSLEANEPQTFVYDEWDFRANDYKPRWCQVRQKTMAEGDPNFYGGTLHSYGGLVSRIRRQFEMMVPEMFRRVRKLEDGEEIDIDDLIEAIVDMKTGSSPSDKFYWRRNKVQREVAAAFLIDTSASTAEAIDEGKRNADDWDAPDDPVEYMVWLRTRRGEAARRTYKRIIDVEKEAIVLIVNALEAIGDIYGIYGFSGYGRENVEYYTIKDLDEPFSDRVKRRIDRVAPLHATRMGPAIRHTTAKLEQADARTKILFLVSDGRPQDRGYSREGVEKEYAVHDTRMALEEARRKDINAFCLTVDKNGHDYLKTMCADMGYEVLDNIYDLPERLLFLYKRLTM